MSTTTTPVPQLRHYRGQEYINVPSETVVVGDLVVCFLSDAVAAVKVTSISETVTDLGAGIELRFIRYGYDQAAWWVDASRMTGQPGHPVSIVPREEHRAAIANAPAVRRVADEDLTDLERDDINAALAEWLPSTDFDGSCELSVAYNAGYPLAAAWLIFSSTEAPALGEVFDRHGIAVDPDRWADGWGEMHATFGVKCDGPDGCGSYTYAQPCGSITWLVDVEAAEWPTRCGSCRNPLPVKHFTDTYETRTSGAWSECTCGWESGDELTEDQAHAAADRHRLHPDGE